MKSQPLSIKETENIIRKLKNGILRIDKELQKRIDIENNTRLKNIYINYLKTLTI